jgi:hypothetical protein
MRALNKYPQGIHEVKKMQQLWLRVGTRSEEKSKRWGLKWGRVGRISGGDKNSG